MILALFVALICYLIVQVVFISRNGIKEPLIPPKGNILIIDTETDCIPKDCDATALNTENSPRIIGLAYNKIAPNGQLLSKNYFIISPDYFSIGSGEPNIDICSNTDIQENRISIKIVLDWIDKEAVDCKYLVAHNIDFVYAVVFSEYSRLNLDTNNLSSLKRICTMKGSINIFKIPSSNGYKNPSLNDLHQELFSSGITGMNNPQTNAEHCMRCFKELFNRKVIRL